VFHSSVTSQAPLSAPTKIPDMAALESAGPLISGGKDGWVISGSQEVFRVPVSRSAVDTVSILKGPAEALSKRHSHMKEDPTADGLGQLDQFRIGRTSTTDATSFRPDAVVINGFGDHLCHILHRRECHGKISVSRDDGTAIVQIPLKTKDMHVLGGRIREAEVVQEQPGLKKAVLQHLSE